MYYHVGMEIKHHEKRISAANFAYDSEKCVTDYALAYAGSLFVLVHP